MRKTSKPSSKSKKKYAAPKLTTHGSVAKLTQRRGPIIPIPISGLSF